MRARLNREIRDFFHDRDVLEVETPLLGRFGVTDPHIDCIPAGDGECLQPSPEYHMKRLLAADPRAIYQITRAFRRGERGHRHNPEFSMLEWYRPGFDLDALIDECLALFHRLLGEHPVARMSYRRLFRRHLDIDPLTAATEDIRTGARESDPDLPALDRQGLLDWLFATRLEPRLPATTLTVVDDFPPTAAALATVSPDAEGDMVARRFEVFLGARELANGYLELTDAEEQARRLAADRAWRRQAGREEPAADPRLVEALRAGLPACSGVAVGLDRLLMCLLDTDRIDEVLNFPAPRH